MKLEGLTVNFLGDSITEGCGTTSPDKAFHQLIKDKYNLKYAYNYGVGGTRIARQFEPSKGDTKYDLTFEIRAQVMDKNADAIIVFGGTNDYGHGDAPFGNPESDSEDIYTFCGALNSLISKLESDFPKAKIVFMTPIHRLYEKNANIHSKVLEDYVNAMLTICEKRDVSVINLFGINPLNPSDASLVPDGLHPNDAGHAVMAEVIAQELLKI